MRPRAGTPRLGKLNSLDFQEFDKIQRVFAAGKIREIFRTRGAPGVAWTIEFRSFEVRLLLLRTRTKDLSRVF
jgi:hypothetical protein